MRRTLRRLHVRFWHCPAARLIDILKHAGAPHEAIKMVPSIIDTCKICRLWMRPSPKSITTTRLATDFNQVVQFDILFHKEFMIGVLIDESIRWTAADVLEDKAASTLIMFLTTMWIRPYGSMRLLVSDQEGGLMGEAIAQHCDRWNIEMKPKAPGEHAQLVERHHDILRKLIARIESQLDLEGVGVPIRVIVAEAVLAKNVLITISGFTP